MRSFLEINRYNIVKFSVLTAGIILSHKLAYEIAEAVWEKTIPLFDDSEKNDVN